LYSTDILLARLAHEEELTLEMIHALAKHKSLEQIKQLIKTFKHGNPRLRERISEVFKLMGFECEQVLINLLTQEPAALKSFITEIMEKTGFIEAQVRKLSHSDPGERRKAAEMLALVETTSAFRGMVLAAKDPDQEVRVNVIKALEKLNKKEAHETLLALKNDPDKRVRKYTNWAIHRVRAKTN
jgi:HEAT repeat protein